MHDSLTVDMCVAVRKDCPITYLVTTDNQAEFSFGGQRAGFHYAFDKAALRAFLMVGAEALAEMEAPATQARVGDGLAADLAPLGTRPA